MVIHYLFLGCEMTNSSEDEVIVCNTVINYFQLEQTVVDVDVFVVKN